MRSPAISLLALLCVLLLAACATSHVAPQTDALFNDHLFSAPSERISADDVFAISDDMRRFLTQRLATQMHSTDTRAALIDAIYVKGQLRLEYDSTTTRNAAQAFAARSGNCLSLVIMTAAFARGLGLPVQFQNVYVDDTVSRRDDMLFFIGHVNLTLAPRQSILKHSDLPNLMTVDFLPPEETQGLHIRVIEEQTIVAMYMNNRAAEALARGDMNDAYWWARAAIGQDPEFVSAYNTLGVIYRSHGNPAEAERILAYALEREPKNTRVVANLIRVMNDLGQVAKAQVLTRKLELLEPDPPYSYFDQGLQAMRDRDYTKARDLFAKEVARAPFDHEFHFWLASAYASLGNSEQARRQMLLAMAYTSTRRDHDLYAAKLDRIRASQLN
ncbi:MAG: tetratricopeptide repeat protein [Casimicrobiaceae bacterium]